MNAIRIGTRASKLAVVQAEMLARYLQQQGVSAELVRLTTTGDRILDRTLDKVGGKGLFVKELDQALLDGRSDVSVHSLKDVPAEVPEGLPLLGYSKREDPRDALILPEGKTEMDFSLPIGCASNRRIVQLREKYPQATFAPIRGNVQTRLRKLDEGQYGATVLAVAGLKRLGLEHRISRVFSTEEMIPAAGQGVLAVQGRQGEDYSCLNGFFDDASRDTSRCERAFLAALNGGCSTPTAAYAYLDEQDRLHVSGLFYDEHSGVCLRAKTEGERKNAARLGQQLAEKLLRKLK